MDFDIAVFGVFIIIAGVIALSLWSDYRVAEEKRRRLEKMRQHWGDASRYTVMPQQPTSADSP